jgi:DNA-binding NarL/FixJ family response regulator
MATGGRGQRTGVNRWAVALEDRLLREVVVRVVEEQCPGAEWVSWAGVAKVREALAAAVCPALICGVSLGDGDLTDLLAEALAGERVERVLVVTDRGEPHVAEALSAAGVQAAVNVREDGIEGVREGVRRLSSGGGYWSEGFLATLRGEGPHAQVARRLTPAELYLFAILGEGLDDASAAEDLPLSVQGVHAYRKRIHHKLGLQHKGQLVSLAVRYGLVRFTASAVERPGLAALRARCVFRPRRGRGAAEVSGFNKPQKITESCCR